VLVWVPVLPASDAWAEYEFLGKWEGVSKASDIDGLCVDGGKVVEG
jgi:hypothetical protein